MEKLNINELFSIALQLDLPNLLKFCASSNDINSVICKRRDIWLKKLEIEFSDRDKLEGGPKNPKELYILLWNLRDLKEKLHLPEDIYKLYSSKVLNLNGQRLNNLPDSIKVLRNLKKLNIRNNNLRILPTYLPQSLEELYLDENKLKELPDLPNKLRVLYADTNELEKLPDKLPDSLFLLSVNNNKLKKFPKKMPKNLEQLFMSNNPAREEWERIKREYPDLDVFP